MIMRLKFVVIVLITLYRSSEEFNTSLRNNSHFPQYLPVVLY